MNKIHPGNNFVFTGICIPDREVSYISLFTAMLMSRRPAWQLNVVNRCCPQKCTAYDLRNFWEDDVIQLRPAWLCVLVGIDDVRKWIRRENDWKEYAPGPFLSHYDYLIGRAKDQCGSRIILLDPFLIAAPHEENWTDQIFAELPAYYRAMAALSRKYNAIRVPLQTIFQRQFQHRPCNDFRQYPDIPNALGHLVVAEAMFQAIR
ncbi:MAG: hypothetical protein PHW60_12295 [Kiritimatiellae bacterium]|nr:hypothetical protein [Kiritimatiellia bacterium]